MLLAVYEHRKMIKSLDVLPLDILKKYEKWKEIVMLNGLDGLRQIKGFNDEALSGIWQGFRSSRLSYKYRVIYQLDVSKAEVYVFRISAHDYR